MEKDEGICCDCQNYVEATSMSGSVEVNECACAVGICQDLWGIIKCTHYKEREDNGTKA
jgi:hypothetical protein